MSGLAFLWADNIYAGSRSNDTVRSYAPSNLL